jgi:murein DD-endopeptidase MepM/ murein hydrolase activator NlpD
VKNKKTFSNWLTNRYLLIIRNEENFAEKSTFSFTYARLILLATVAFIVMMTLSLLLTRTLLKQWFDPRYEQMQSSRRLAELTVKVDSLEMEVMSKDRFINNFKRVLSGDTTDALSDMDNVSSNNPVVEQDIDVSRVAPVDSIFRQEFEQSDISLINPANNQDLDVFLFAPLSGLVSAPYNVKEGHYGVDVVAKKNEPVKCVADGTVIMASWTQDSGYVIAVQHRNDLISVYKHNAELLKKVGNFVNAGEIISIIGNTGDLTDGPHLHFELWSNGNSVNPEEFVTF